MAASSTSSPFRSAPGHGLTKQERAGSAGHRLELQGRGRRKCGGLASRKNGGDVQDMPKRRVILLGDSIIDNSAYVQPGEPDVTTQLEALLPKHAVIKRALDGAVCADVLTSQVANLESADCIILSVGGNDALQYIDILEAPTPTTAKEVLERLGTIREQFRRTYTLLLDRL